MCVSRRPVRGRSPSPLRSTPAAVRARRLARSTAGCQPAGAPGLQTSPRLRAGRPGRAAAPPRGACVSGLWPARVGEPGRSHSRPAATPPPARPGGAGIRDQQGPLGVQAEADGGQHPSLGQSRDSAPHPGRRRPGRQGQAQQAELCHRTTDPRASPPRGSNSRSAGSTGRLPELRAPEGSGHPSGDSIEVGTADMVPSNAGSNHSQAPGIGSVTGPDAADRRVGGDRSIVAYGLSDEISGVTARPRSQRPTPRNVTWAHAADPDDGRSHALTGAELPDRIPARNWLITGLYVKPHTASSA